MTTLLSLDQVHPTHHGCERPTSLDIVFIHGLIGDPDSTWRHGPTAHWPQWVADDHPEARVWCVGYPASAGAVIGSSRQLASEALAIVLAALLHDQGIGSRPCVLVCHSLGGLLAKRMLLDHAKRLDTQAFRESNVAGLMFLGTPHRGSDWASVLDSAGPIKKLAVEAVLGWMGVPASGVGSQVLNTSQLIAALKSGAIPLQHLNEDFGVHFTARRNLGRPLLTRVLRETEGYPVASAPLIVDADSADPNLPLDADGKKVPVEAVPACHHVALSKPPNRDHQIARALRGLVQDVKHECGIFELGDSRGNEAAHLIFLALRNQPLALKQPRLAEPIAGEAPLLRARRIAESLGGLRGDRVHDAINRIGQALDDLAGTAGANAADVEAIEKVVGALVLLLVDPGEIALKAHAGTGTSSACGTFRVPSQEGLSGLGTATPDEYLHIVVEACDAVLKQRPVRLGRDGEGRIQSLGTKIIHGLVAGDPNNWNDEAQVDHLALCIADESFAPIPRAGRDRFTPPESDERQRQRNYRNLIRRLEALRARQIGLVVHDAQPASPFGSEKFQTLASERFKGMVSFALADDSEAADDLLDLVAELHGTLYGVVESAHKARQRLGPHA